MPTIFVRDWNGDRSRVTREPHPDCGWVFAGKGIATRKIDGACCLIRDGRLFKRALVKAGKPVPADFEEVDFDEETGKRVGWRPVGDGPDDVWFRAGFNLTLNLKDGTHELIGPGVQGNPEGVECPMLIPHSSPGLALFDPPPPRTFDGLKLYLAPRPIEGIVWQHQDGRMAKIKKRDFGMSVRGGDMT